MVQHVALVSACVKKSNLSVERILSLVLCEIQQVTTLFTNDNVYKGPTAGYA